MPVSNSGFNLKLGNFIYVESYDTRKGVVSGDVLIKYTPSNSAQEVVISTTLTPIGEFVFDKYESDVGSVTRVDDNYVLTIPANYEGVISILAKWGKDVIYGVEWDGNTDPAFSRTDAALSFADPNPYYSGMSGDASSPFDNISPWKDMTVVEDSEAGTLVKIPKFYYKWTRDGNSMKLQISPSYMEGYNVSPAHQDRGDDKGERDVVYVGKYHCATSTYKSITGVAQQASNTRSAFRTSISNLGTTIWQWDYAMVWTIRMLYLVEFANWNSQAKIGYGCSASGSKVNNGKTDAITYHTGTTATSRTSYGFTKYRNIEGLWDNVYDWCDGIYFSSSGQYIIKNPANFSDTANGTLVTSSNPNTAGYISAWSSPTVSGYDWAITPSSFKGSDSTYITDYSSVNSSSPCVCVGGNYGQGAWRGIFCAFCYGTSVVYPDIGSRLQKLP